MSYKPGLHILIGITTQHNSKLKDEKAWLAFIENQINSFDLKELGKVVHRFDNEGGYTAVHCLTESHISIHTWPEHNYCTCDVFLSNYQKYNNNITKNISENIVAYFESTQYEIKEHTR